MFSAPVESGLTNRGHASPSNRGTIESTHAQCKFLVGTRFRFWQGECHHPPQHENSPSVETVVVGCCYRSTRSSIQFYRSPDPETRNDQPATKSSVQNATTSKSPTHEFSLNRHHQPTPAHHRQSITNFRHQPVSHRFQAASGSPYHQQPSPPASSGPCRLCS
jgi:hypothetical protein